MIFSFSLFFSWGKAYFILSVGHGAVERSLLKLQIVQVQLLNQHSSRWHSDLKSRTNILPSITIVIHLDHLCASWIGEQSFVFLALFIFPLLQMVWIESLPWTKQKNWPLWDCRPSSVQGATPWSGCMYLSKNTTTNPNCILGLCN